MSKFEEVKDLGCGCLTVIAAGIFVVLLTVGPVIIVVKLIKWVWYL